MLTHTLMYYLGAVTSGVFGNITSQITGGKKQSEAALFAVRVHLPCVRPAWA